MSWKEQGCGCRCWASKRLIGAGGCGSQHKLKGWSARLAQRAVGPPGPKIFWVFLGSRLCVACPDKPLG